MRQSGFTLVEMILSILLVGLVGAVMAPMIYQGSQGAIVGQKLATLDWSARESIERLDRELYAMRVLNITTANATTLTFTSNTAETVTFSYDAGNQRILRNSDVVANNVSSFTFSYYDSSGTVTAVLANIYYVTITATFTVDGQVSPTYTTTTFIRVLT